MPYDSHKKTEDIKFVAIKLTNKNRPKRILSFAVNKYDDIETKTIDNHT